VLFWSVRFEHVPLVTPNGDVLVKELNFEVCNCLCFSIVRSLIIGLIMDCFAFNSVKSLCFRLVGRKFKPASQPQFS